MPIAFIHMIEGRDPEKKRRLMQNVAKAIAESIDAPLDKVRVIVQEHEAELWSIGDQTIAERRGGRAG